MAKIQGSYIQIEKKLNLIHQHV